ncbi:MAG: hypothetical protein ACOC1F_04165 [Myxococcota bacterium]
MRFAYPPGMRRCLALSCLPLGLALGACSGSPSELRDAHPDAAASAADAGIDTSSDGDGGTQTGSDPDADACSPRSCAELGATCGVLDDGCGALIHCGSCAGLETCGGGGVLHQCGCTPRTCDAVGADCGELDDGCGETIACGACSDPDTCGGGNAPNVCAHALCEDGWCFEQPYPHPDDLLGGSASSGATFAVGSRGLVLARTSGGWRSLPALTRVPSDLYDFLPCGADDGWAVGQHGAILRFDGTLLSCTRPDGEYWSPLKTDLHAVALDAQGALWAAGEDGILTFDNGAWQMAKPVDGTLYDLAAASDGSLWAVGGRETPDGFVPLVMRRDGDWEPVALTGAGVLHAVLIGEDGSLTAVGARASGGSLAGALVLYDDGTGWSEMPVPADVAALRSIARVGDATWAVGDDGSIVTICEGTVRAAARVFGEGSLRLLASEDVPQLVGQAGLVATYRHGFWEPSVAHLPALDGRTAVVWARRPHDVWAGGDGWVLRWNGIRWTVAPVPISVAGLYGTSPDNVWVAGNRRGSVEGVVLHHDGDGWAEVHTVAGEVFEQVVGTSSADVRVRTAEDTWYHFDGHTWEQRSGEAFPVAGTSGALDEPGWALDPAKGFVRDPDGDPHATRVWPFDGLQGVPHAAWALSEDEVWAVGADGIVHGLGGVWTKKLDGADVRGLHGVEPDDVWFVGEKAGVEGPMWRWNGAQLEAVDAPPEDLLHTVSIAPDGAVICAGVELHRRTASGWSSEVLPGQGPIRAVWAWSEQDVWAARGRMLLHYDGTQWSVIDPFDKLDRPPMGDATEMEVHRIFGLSPQRLLFLGGTPERDAAIVLVRSEDGWGNGVLQSLGGEATFTAVWGTDLENVWVTMGEVGWVYHYRHSLRMFDTVDSVMTSPLQSMAGFGGHRWSFGRDGVIAHAPAL